MNKYQIQVDHTTENEWDWICVYANSDEDAIQKAKMKLSRYQNPVYSPEDDYEVKYWKDYNKVKYAGYEISKYLPIFSVERNCEPPENYDIIYPLDSNNSKDEENIYMDIYDYMYWGDYNLQIQKLADKALPEKWSFENKNDNYILKNYLKYTFIKLQEENKIIEENDYCVFDTGLFSEYYAPIYAYGELYKNPSENTPKWYFKGFKDKYELGSLDVIEKFPERADYFSDPSMLVFNWHLDININHKHILDDLNTLKRLPESIKNSDSKLETLKGVIDTAIKKVIANYKLAVPHYYCNKIQLMIPLYFGKSDKPDVALVLNRMKGNYYQATTCLSMDMAYMDARLIAKPESNWLIAEKITEE